jgi:hypothetical protein
MAICLKSQAIYVPYSSGANPKTTYVFIPDTVTPVSSCDYVLIRGDEMPQKVFIDSSEDAVSIASAFIVFISVLGLYRIFIKFLWSVDTDSEEKH